jgi:hypothetical protein
MAAIVTEDFRKNNIDRFFDDVFKTTAAGGKNYYIGLGKTDPYDPDQENFVESSSSFTPPTPSGSVVEKEDIKRNLMTLIKVESTDVRRLIPQVKFQTGQKYKVYNPADPTCFDSSASEDLKPCYVLYTGGDNISRIYLCLGNNNGGLTTEPIPDLNTGSVGPFQAAQNSTDGYIWAYVSTFKTGVSNKFSNSRTFMDLPRDSEVDGWLEDGTDNGRSRAAQGTAGLLYGFHISRQRPGKNYPGTHPRTVAAGTALSATIVGTHINGTTISANNTCQVETGTDGQITNIVWTLANAQALGYGRTTTTDSAGAAVTGLSATGNGGIKEASLIITDSEMTVDAGTLAGHGDHNGSGFEKAEIKALIAPQNGFGHSPQTDLPSYYAGISADFKGTVGLDSAGDDTGENEYVAEALVNVTVREVSLLRDTNNTMTNKYSSGDHKEDDSPYEDTTDYTAEQALNCLQYLQVASTSSSIRTNAALANSISGAYIQEEGVTGVGARAWLDQVSHIETTDPADADPGTGGPQAGGFRIYFHQNSSRAINKKPFGSNGSVSFRNPNGSKIHGDNVAYTIVKQGEYVQGEGDVLFTEFREPITRNDQQTEEVRLILQF